MKQPARDSRHHALRLRRLELLNELEELEAAVAELTVVMSTSAPADSDEFLDQYERRDWLRRQHTGVLVILNETERTLLEFGADGWDEE